MKLNQRLKKLETMPIGYVVDLTCRLCKVDKVKFCEESYKIFGDSKLPFLHFCIGGIRRAVGKYSRPTVYSFDALIERIKQ